MSPPAAATSAKSWLIQSVGGLPSVFWVLCAGTLVNKLGAFVVPFLTLFLVNDRKMSVAQATFIASMYGAGSMFAGPLGGALSDRLGRRAVMVMGLVLGGAMMIVVGFLENPVLLPAATALLGLTSDLARPAVSATVADVVPPKDRIRAYNLLYWTINLAYSFSTMLAGLMASRGYRLLFVADAITSFAFALIILARVPETRPAGTQTRPSLRASLAEPVRDPVFLPFVFITFVIAAVFFQWNSALPLEMQANGISPQKIGMLMAVNGVAIVLLQPFSGPVAARFERSRGLALSALLLGVGFYLEGLSQTMLAYGLATVVWTLGEIVHAAISPSVVADLAPEHARGGYQGLYHMAWGVASFVGPAAGGWMLGHLGSNALWTTCLGLGVAAAAGHLAIGKRRRVRIEQLRAAEAAATGLAD